MTVTSGVPGPADTARSALAAYLALHTRAFRSAEQAVRADADDSVHQMRVAARRLRSGLRVFRPVLEREWADGLRGELAWVAGELGRFRDSEVLLARLEPGLPAAAEPARKLLDQRLTDHVREARAQAREILDSDRYADLNRSLAKACAEPATASAADEPAGQVLPPLVARAWRRLATSVQDLLAHERAMPGGAPDEEWHQTRIRAKRARYAAEAVAPTLGKDAERFAKRLSRVTDLLGSHQDAVRMATVIEDAAVEADADMAYALGVLGGVERAHAAAVRREFAKFWPKVDRKKLRRWFET